MNEEKLYQTLCDRLEKHLFEKPWLLIYDGAAETFPIPQKGGFIIVASKEFLSFQSPSLDSIELLKFKKSEASAFLEAMTGEKDPVKLRKWVKTWDRSPLALRIAAAYINNDERLDEEGFEKSEDQDSSPSHPSVEKEHKEGHVGGLAKHFEALIAKQNEGVQKIEKKETVENIEKRNQTDLFLTNVLDLILNRLAQKNRQMSEWIYLCAYLYPKGIPLGWIFEWIRSNNISKSHVYQTGRLWLDWLLSYSLLSYHSKTRQFSLHGKVQEALLSLDNSSKSYLKAVALLLKIGKKFLNRNKVIYLEEAENWLLHAEHLLNHPHHFEQVPKYQQAKLRYYMGAFLQAIGNLEKAGLAYVMAAEHSEDKNFTANALNCAGFVIMKQGDPESALPLFTKALNLNPPLSTCGKILDNLGSCHFKLNQFQDALHFFKKAYKIKQQIVPLPEPAIALSLTYLGRVFMKLEKYEKAKNLFLQAWKIQEKRSDRYKNESLKDLASVFFYLKEYEQAKKYYQEALKINTEENNTEANSELAINLNNLGIVLEELIQFEEAKKMYMRAIEIQEELYLGNNFEKIASLYNLAGVLKKLGSFKEAKEALEKALGMLDALDREDYPVKAACMNRLALVLQEMKQYKEAQQMHCLAYELLEQLHAGDHSMKSATLNNLSLVKQNLKELENAEKYARESLEMILRLNEGAHPETAAAHYQLGNVLLERGQYEAAQEHHLQALNMRRIVYGDKPHPDIAASLNSLGKILFHLKEYQEAKECYEKGLQLYRQIFPNDNFPPIQQILLNMKDNEEELSKLSAKGEKKEDWATICQVM